MVYLTNWEKEMKKILLLVFGLLLAIPAFAYAFHPMDGKTYSTKAGPFSKAPIIFSMSTEKHMQKYFVKPFICKIWTNYQGDPGFGIKISLQYQNARLEGTYPQNKTFIINKDSPQEYYTVFGIVTSLYDPGPVINLMSTGCSPYDSHCPDPQHPKPITIVYESCSLQ